MTVPNPEHDALRAWTALTAKARVQLVDSSLSPALTQLISNLKNSESNPSSQVFACEDATLVKLAAASWDDLVTVLPKQLELEDQELIAEVAHALKQHASYLNRQLQAAPAPFFTLDSVISPTKLASDPLVK